MAIVLREASHRKLRLNLSSGASHFKRIRGGVLCIEYTAVIADICHCRHLSLPTSVVASPIGMAGLGWFDARRR